MTMRPLKEYIHFNPAERLAKGTVAKKVAMDKLQPFTRHIGGYELAPYTGGTKFRNGDTVMARITPCLENGKTALVSILNDNEVGFGFTEYIVLRAKESVTDSRFVYYFATNPWFRDIAIKSMVGSSGRQRVQQSVLENLEVSIPPLPIQQQIAKILGSLDDKIELNRRINDNLEQQAQAIFKSWFVDFEPFHDGEFVESELGMIPKGWRVGKTADIVTVKGGSTPRTTNAEYWDGTYYWATPKDLSGLRYPVLLDTERKITDLGVSQISSGVLPKGSLLLSSRAPVGYLAISDVPVSINQGFIAINGTTVSNLYMLYWLRENMEIVKGRANGSTFQEISKSSFKEIPVIIPDKECINSFENIAYSLFDEVIANENENLRLSRLRDTLLPKLMSGELSVTEAQV